MTDELTGALQRIEDVLKYAERRVDLLFSEVQVNNKAEHQRHSREIFEQALQDCKAIREAYAENRKRFKTDDEWEHLNFIHEQTTLLAAIVKEQDDENK